jgi:hypothetical protein
MMRKMISGFINGLEYRFVVAANERSQKFSAVCSPDLSGQVLRIFRRELLRQQKGYSCRDFWYFSSEKYKNRVQDPASQMHTALQSELKYRKKNRKIYQVFPALLPI